jgi:hypothetical protein
MQALTPGHLYQLNNFDDPKQHQTLQFIHKDIAGNLISDGTTNEEVLLMLTDRLRVLQEKLPSRETAIAITKCEEALLWLNKRTADRIQRGVEGTGKA